MCDHAMNRMVVRGTSTASAPDGQNRAHLARSGIQRPEASSRAKRSIRTVASSRIVRFPNGVIQLSGGEIWKQAKDRQSGKLG